MEMIEQHSRYYMAYLAIRDHCWIFCLNNATPCCYFRSTFHNECPTYQIFLGGTEVHCNERWQFLFSVPWIHILSHYGRE